MTKKSLLTIHLTRYFEFLYKVTWVFIFFPCKWIQFCLHNLREGQIVSNKDKSPGAQVQLWSVLIELRLYATVAFIMLSVYFLRQNLIYSCSQVSFSSLMGRIKWFMSKQTKIFVIYNFVLGEVIFFLFGILIFLVQR